MKQYIPKSALVAEIEKKIMQYEVAFNNPSFASYEASLIAKGKYRKLLDILQFINTLEVKEVDSFLTPFISFKDMVNIQYPSVNDGIKAHAEIYSFNIESELFNQLTPEQQNLWRKEIEQACISGGKMGVELARDTRYKENLKVKEVDLDKEIDKVWDTDYEDFGISVDDFYRVAKHFFELGIKVAQKGE